MTGHGSKAVLTLMCLLPLLAAPLRAQIPVGARPLGMGGAYTAVANDINSPFWNPAGVTELRGLRVNLFSMNVRLVGQEKVFDLFSHTPTDTQSLIDYVAKFGDENTAAASGGTFGIGAHGWAFSILPFGAGALSPNGGAGFQYVTNANGNRVPVAGSVGKLAGTYGYYYMGTYGMHTDPKTSIGVNAKLITSKLGESTVTFTDSLGHAQIVSQTKDGQNRFAMDVGAIHQVNGDMRVGATLYNLVQPNTDLFPRNLNVGVAWQPVNNNYLLALDVAGIAGRDMNINFGGEYVFGHMFALRGGIYKGRPTLGLGIGSVFNVVYSPDNSLIGATLTF
jgi:hypothetical protein